ncbi:hypothetical protein [Propionivibrio sp.]|uniref:hypothetical protein n=1 Tax=Propionivibrio sp. TaxID=2212460 RepID=UPI003BF1D848
MLRIFAVPAVSPWFELRFLGSSIQPHLCGVKQRFSGSIITKQKTFQLDFGLEPVGQIVSGFEVAPFRVEVGGFRYLFLEIVIALH